MMKESASDFLDRRNGRAGKATHAATPSHPLLLLLIKVSFNPSWKRPLEMKYRDTLDK